MTIPSQGKGLPLLWFLVMTSCIGVIQAQQTLNRSVTVEETRREFIVYLPRNFTPAESLPVLFCFHGGDDSAEGMMRETADFRPLANSERFIAIYPRGLVFEGSTHWNSEGPYDNGTDEIGFTSAMINHVVAEYSANPDRIYACGFSLGGNLMWDLACYLGNRVAAVASVAASMWEWTLKSCSTTDRTGILSIHGTNDTYNPYNGNQYSIPISRLNTHWATINGSENSPENSQFSRGVTRHVWRQGEGCHTVEHYRVQNGSHVWPSFSRQVIWDFVSRYDSSGLIGCGGGVELVVNSYNRERQEVTITINNLPEGRFEIRKSATGPFQRFQPGVEINRSTTFPLTIPNVPEEILLLQVWERP